MYISPIALGDFTVCIISIHQEWKPSGVYQLIGQLCLKCKWFSNNFLFIKLYINVTFAHIKASVVRQNWIENALNDSTLIFFLLNFQMAIIIFF